MTLYLANKRILLGVTGSIAAYKSADLVRQLREARATVRVAMTENAKRFITPLTMQAVSGNPIHEDLFDLHAEAAMGHIELARWADAIIVAPASADFMARLAKGEANDLLTTVCLASNEPLALAPAMNQAMWRHAVTQANLQALEHKNIHIFGPGEGKQACGDVGPGRMIEPAEIVAQLSAIFATGALAGVNVLITAGPTHEAIDPVRFISNGSSGKMGYALAEAAREAGANVTLISGPTNIAKPSNMDCINVISAQDMHDQVMRNIPECDIFLGVAAVGDYRSKVVAKEKLHKDAETVQLELERNPDIISLVGHLPNKPFVVGFAAETQDVAAQAQAKRERKKMDMIIANQVGYELGMGTDDNEVIVIGRDTEISLPSAPKHKLARQIMKMIAAEYRQKKS